MHICFISTYFPQPCGIANYTHNLASALLTVDKNLSLTILAEGEIKSLPNGSFNVLNAFNWKSDYPAEIMSHMEAVAPDIVHIQHEYGIFGIDDRFHRLLSSLHDKGIPTIVTLHTVHTRQSIHMGCTRPQMRRLLKKVDIEKYQRQISSLADLMVVHQEVPIRKVLLRQGVDPPSVITIPHGTYLAELPKETNAKALVGFRPENPLIMAFGYLEKSKNIHLLIEAFRQLKRRIPGANLWLGGYVRFSTPQTLAYRERCLKLIKTYNLEKDINFEYRMITETEVEHVLGAADVVCLVYKEDTRSSSGVLHLAMGLGKAVVASRTPKFHELSEVADEVLVSPSSVRELYSILERLLLDKSFRSSIQQRVRDYAIKTSWFAVANTHMSVYKRLLGISNSSYDHVERALGRAEGRCPQEVN